MTFFVTNTPGSLSAVTVTPTQPLEIAMPFSVDSSGRIAVVTDPIQIAAQHIISIALTIRGERVMRPSIGVGLPAFVFEQANLAAFQNVATSIQNQLATSDSSFVSVSVTVQADPTTPGRFLFRADFQIQNDPQTHTAVFDYTGNLVSP